MSNRPKLTAREYIRREEAGEDPQELAGEVGFTDGQTHAIRMAGEAALRAHRAFTEWTRSGDPRADWVLLWLAGTDDGKLSALRRILDRMGRPVHHKRWAENQERLLDALTDLGTTIRELSLSSGWTESRGLVEHLTPAEITEKDPELLRKLRNAVGRIVCEDLLGPGWRRHDKREAQGPDDWPDALASEALASVEARHCLDEIIGGAPLTPGERTVLEMDAEGLATPDIADALNTSEAAIRRRRSDALKKARRLVSPPA